MRINRSVLIMFLAAAVVIPAALGSALACDKAKAASAVAAADKGEATVNADCAGCDACTKAATLAKHAAAGCDKSKSKAAAVLATDEGAGCPKAAALLAKASGTGCSKTKAALAKDGSGCSKTKADAAALKAKNEKHGCPKAAAAAKETLAEAEEQEQDTDGETVVASNSGE